MMNRTGPRCGVVAVIVERGKLLVIQRAAHIPAPLTYCFPGGGIEPGEREEQALRREVSEELGVEVTPTVRLWTSSTSWGVDLVWWQAELAFGAEPVANPAEVAAWQWCTVAEMRDLPTLLSSNIAFLNALSSGEFRLRGLDL